MLEAIATYTNLPYFQLREDILDLIKSMTPEECSKHRITKHIGKRTFKNGTPLSDRFLNYLKSIGIKRVYKMPKHKSGYYFPYFSKYSMSQAYKEFGNCIMIKSVRNSDKHSTHAVAVMDGKMYDHGDGRFCIWENFYSGKPKYHIKNGATVMKKGKYWYVTGITESPVYSVFKYV